jgi:hypothetical protein
MGEISFCAYNTGAGWRNIIEKMKANATVAEWYKTYGRHPVYAKNKDLPLPEGGAEPTIIEHELAKQERARGPQPRKTKHLPVVSG